MFSRSEILLKAWASYRIVRSTRFAAGDETGRRCFLRPLFANCLRTAWADAKAQASNANAREADRLAAELQTRILASQADLAARMDPMARSARIVEIRSELETLNYAPWGVRIGPRRAHLGAELQLLNAAV